MDQAPFGADFSWDRPSCVWILLARGGCKENSPGVHKVCEKSWRLGLHMLSPQWLSLLIGRGLPSWTRSSGERNLFPALSLDNSKVRHLKGLYNYLKLSMLCLKVLLWSPIPSLYFLLLGNSLRLKNSQSLSQSCSRPALSPRPYPTSAEMLFCSCWHIGQP